ncbi:ATP-binding SpoIIE family protein phosphatase [Streptomyces sp. NPDC002328]|uniref:ATP-binding SpoIIE family protein phosphatase n=1 Tax=Streptomyces sp. NPDC002328 TaxID=3364642 RepID=UPI0036D1F3A1
MSRVWDVPVQDSTRVRDVRVATEEAAAHAGLDTHRTAVAALVATELTTNLLKHAGGGRILINLVGSGDGPGPSVQLTAVDTGPGIGDIAMALRDGYTTAHASLGAGLGTCRRLANVFDLTSRHGRGTVAVARIDHLPPSLPAPHTAVSGPCAGGINMALAQAEHSGDDWAHVRVGSHLTLLLADGLGHGVGAARASTAAVEELRRQAHLPPPDILAHLHTALRPTRGAAVALAQLDLETHRLRFAGVGNVGARLFTAGAWEPLISHPGTVGAAFPATVPVQQARWREDSLLVLHSDGLPSRWTPPDIAELRGHHAAVVAAAILRDASSAARPARDDTSVAVLAPDRRTVRP